MSGVYEIRSVCKPERAYVGSTRNIKRRFIHHKVDLRNNKHHCSKLQRHFNKYGLDDLKFTILEQFEFISKEHLFGREQYYIDTLIPFFNSFKVAGSGLGFKPLKKTINKIQKSRKGWKMTNEQRERVSESKKGIKNPNFGKKFTWEHKKNISKALTGRYGGVEHELTQEHIRKIQEKRLPLMIGRIASEETRVKLRMISKKRYPKIKDRLIASLIGNKHTLGYKHTPLALQKISEASKKMWAKRRLKDNVI